MCKIKSLTSIANSDDSAQFFRFISSVAVVDNTKYNENCSNTDADYDVDYRLSDISWKRIYIHDIFV